MPQAIKRCSFTSSWRWVKFNLERVGGCFGIASSRGAESAKCRTTD